MSLTAAYGLLAHALIFGALLAQRPLGLLQPRVGLAATALALLVGIAPLLHGWFGPPSLTLLQLALLQLAGRSSPLSLRPAGGLLVCIVGVYGLALVGSAPFDPYRLGFQPSALLAALLAVGLLLYWRRRYDWLLILAVDLFAYAAGLFANLWDALLDPLLGLLALGVVARHGLQRVNASRRR